MNWLNDYVKPKLQRAFNKKDTPDNLWHKCSNCGTMHYTKDFKANACVCAKCDHHERMGPADRFAALFGEGEYALLCEPTYAEDPLVFTDQKAYPDRLKDAREKVGSNDALGVAVGTIEGLEIVAASQNFFFMGGSMGMGVGEAFIAAAEEACARRAPFVIFTAAGGARMQEGILSLMQMPRTTVAIEMLREAGLPYIVVLTDPTTGGVSASYAMLGDIQIAEPGAMIGFAGRRVIENTIREKLPDNFQTAEYLLDHGMIDMVVHRKELPETLARLLRLLMNRPAPAEAA